jgi:hypothetical protein
VTAAGCVGPTLTVAQLICWGVGATQWIALSTTLGDRREPEQAPKLLPSKYTTPTTFVSRLSSVPPWIGL